MKLKNDLTGEDSADQLQLQIRFDPGLGKEPFFSGFRACYRFENLKMFSFILFWKNSWYPASDSRSGPQKTRHVSGLDLKSGPGSGSKTKSFSGRKTQVARPVAEPWFDLMYEFDLKVRFKVNFWLFLKSKMIKNLNPKVSGAGGTGV